jgi:hypothetical protein
MAEKHIRSRNELFRVWTSDLFARNRMDRPQNLRQLVLLMSKIPSVTAAPMGVRFCGSLQFRKVPTAPDLAI